MCGRNRFANRKKIRSKKAKPSFLWPAFSNGLESQKGANVNKLSVYVNKCQIATQGCHFIFLNLMSSDLYLFIKTISSRLHHVVDARKLVKFGDAERQQGRPQICDAMAFAHFLFIVFVRPSSVSQEGVVDD